MLTLSLQRGGSAIVTATDGDQVTLLSSLSSPPGSTLELAEEGRKYRVKVRSCRRQESPDEAGRAFQIDGRWVSLSRSDRERVLSATGGRGQDEA